MTIHCYRDRAGQWRWRMCAGGKIIADCGEGYSRKDSLKRAVARLQRRLARPARECWLVPSARPSR
jgi:uncharacterized protein YegP (UPF0339 family)